MICTWRFMIRVALPSLAIFCKKKKGIRWHVEANGNELPFTRGASVYMIDPTTQKILTGFDIPEPTTKVGYRLNGKLADLTSPLSIFFESPPKILAGFALVFYFWLNFISDIPSGKYLTATKKTKKTKPAKPKHK